VQDWYRIVIVAVDLVFSLGTLQPFYGALPLLKGDEALLIKLKKLIQNKFVPLSKLSCGEYISR